MGNFNKLCEMNISDLLSNLLGTENDTKSIKTGHTAMVVQPDSNVGSCGDISGQAKNNINVVKLDSGDIEVRSKDLNIKLSNDVYEAIKQFIKGEESNG